MSQIIKPEGIELMEYLNEGYAICNKCGAVMDRQMDVEPVEVLIRAVNCHAQHLTSNIRERKS